MSLTAAKVRRRSLRVLRSVGALRQFETVPATPYGDALGEDPSSSPGAPVRFRGSVTSLETQKSGETHSICVMGDVRKILGAALDEGVSIREVTVAGVAVTGPGGLWGTIVPTSVELPMTTVSAYSVVNIQQGAPG